MADQYTVTTTGVGSRNTPVWAAGVAHPPVTLVNQGTVSIYVDETPSAGVNGQQLSAGSTLLWDADRALYAWTATSSSTLLVSPNQGAGFDAGAIAAQLNTQGLPQAIAAQINLVGVPPIDIPFAVYTSPNATSSVNTGVLDVTRYQSLYISWNDVPLPLSSVGIDTITVTWYLDAAGTTEINRTYYDVSSSAGLGGLSSGMEGSLLKRAPYVRFVVAATAQSNGKLTIEGSYRTVTQDDVFFLAADSPNSTPSLTPTSTRGSQVLSWVGTAGAVMDYIYYPSFHPGTYKLYATVPVGAAASGLYIFNIGKAAEFYGGVIPAAGAGHLADEVFLPANQIFVKFTPGGINYIYNIVLTRLSD
jgi:hypothetical protein